MKEKINRKAAHVDFSKPEYSSFSDEEVQILKSLTSKGSKKNLRNCPKHGLHEEIFVKIYDNNFCEKNYLGCPKCLGEKK